MAEIKSILKRQIVIAKKDLLDGYGRFCFIKGTPLVVSSIEAFSRFGYDEARFPDYLTRADSILFDGETHNKKGACVHTFSEFDFNVVSAKVDSFNIRGLNFYNRYNYLPLDDRLLEKTNYKLVPYIPCKKMVPYSLFDNLKSVRSLDCSEGYGINIVYKGTYEKNNNSYTPSGIFDGIFRSYSRVSTNFIHRYCLDKIAIFHKEKCKNIKGALEKIKNIPLEFLAGAESVELRFGNEKEITTQEFSDLFSIIFTVADIIKLRG